MEPSGSIESECKVILLFENESQNVIILIIIQHGPFCFSFLGREYLSSSEGGRGRRTTELEQARSRPRCR